MESPEEIRLVADSEAAVQVGMGNHYIPLKPEELDLVLALASGRTLAEVSHERGKYPAWASHKLQSCMVKYAAHTHEELIVKLIATGQLQVQVKWREKGA